MIKKVVVKEKEILEKVRTKYNPKNIYVWKLDDEEDILQLHYNERRGTFKWNWLRITDGAIKEFNSFEDAIINGVEIGKLVYVLENFEEFKQYILGKGDFSKVETYRTKNIEDDEVHIDDISEDKIYVLVNGKEEFYKAHCVYKFGNDIHWEFVSLKNSIGRGSIVNSLKNLILNQCSFDLDVFELDNLEDLVNLIQGNYV